MRPQSLDDLRRVCVIMETRPDGGLRVYSDDVPGFVLSHPNCDAVMADVIPALETIIAAMIGSRVTVSLSDGALALPSHSRAKAMYEARLAA